MTRKKIKIGDLVENGLASIKTGPFGTQLHAKDYVETGTPVINVRNIGYSTIKEENLEFIDEETVKKLSDHLLKPKDIVFGRKGAVDRHAFILDQHHNWFQGSDCIRLRLFNAPLIPKYLSLYFLTHEHKKWMEAQGSHGSTMASLNQAIIKNITVNVPSLETQEQIVSVLSAYDDLIDNNLKRIKLLEESAQLLYTEWFVNLRFPGHEHVKIVDGVPEGWETTSVFEATEVLSGGTPKTSNPEYWGDEIPFFTPKDTGENFYVLRTEKNITKSGLDSCNSKLYPKNTVFITARGTVGKIVLTQRGMAMNQSCYALVGKAGIPQLFLFLALRSAVLHFKQVAVGGVFDTIIVDTFKKIPFLKPSQLLISEFEEIVQPIFQQTENLLLQNQKLKEARDLLLPRLMDGIIEV